MSTQNALHVGDIITVKQHKKGKQHLLVVYSECEASDHGNGEVPYWVNQLKCIEIHDTHRRPGVDGYASNPLNVRLNDRDHRVYEFYFERGSMNGRGKCIDDSDVTVHGKAIKLKAEVVTTYTMSGVKYHDEG